MSDQPQKSQSLRANMPPEWEGDPLSDEIDGLRRVFSSTLPIAGEGKVKALEWYKPLGNSTLSRADTILGSYRVWTHFEANGEWFWDGGNGHENAATSEGGAKAAAQSDFETRILSALISSPGNDGGQEVEAVGEAGEMPGSNGGFTMAAAMNVRGDLYDADVLMADGGDTVMTAAENVLAWLLIEKIGVPDDVGYSPNQAQEIILRRLDLARELEKIDSMLAEGQGDDEGHPIMPEFTKGMTTYAKVEACLHLLERRRDALFSA